VLLFQTQVGFLIVLWFLVRSLDLALASVGAVMPRWVWAVAYFVLAALLLIALVLAGH